MASRIRFAKSLSQDSSAATLIAKILTLVLTCCAFGTTVQAQDELIEEIVVIAERLGGSVQEVPTAITAISAEMMDRQQIENTSDMQLTVPNVSYSKGNFTTSAFQIRGIGNTAVGSTADSGVSVHINDIPIAPITREYMQYLDVMRDLNLDVAGEFMVMAATLIHIKSKMLVPVEPTEAEGEEDYVDPREELVRRLLELQRYIRSMPKPVWVKSCSSWGNVNACTWSSRSSPSFMKRVRS